MNSGMEAEYKFNLEDYLVLGFMPAASDHWMTFVSKLLGNGLVLFTFEGVDGWQ